MALRPDLQRPQHCFGVAVQPGQGSIQVANGRRMFSRQKFDLTLLDKGQRSKVGRHCLGGDG